jgi:hypothetical protein
MNQKFRFALVLAVGLLLLVSNAWGCVFASFGGSSGGSYSWISETLSTNPEGSYYSEASLGHGDAPILEQDTQIEAMDYSATKGAYSDGGDYAEVTYSLKNAVLRTAFSAEASNMGGYAIAKESWDVVSADSIAFTARAKNRKGYEAKVTTDITNGGVDFENEAMASATTATATQKLNRAWGDEILRSLYAKNGRKIGNHYSKTSFVYTGDPPKYDYEDTATATYSDAVVTPAGGPQIPSPPTIPPGEYDPPPFTPPTLPYTPYQWPTGEGW